MSSFSNFFRIASILTPRFSAMSRASKILSPSALDRFSSGDFFDPLNDGGEGSGLSFRLGVDCFKCGVNWPPPLEYF